MTFMKICKICNKEKEKIEFLNGSKQTVRVCRECRRKIAKQNRQLNLNQQRQKDKENYQKSKEHRIKYAREYRLKYPERTRATNLKMKYGITQDIYNKMLFNQKNKCAICERDINEYGKVFCIDHNHSTGKIRGLLCDPCNYGLGFYEKHKNKYINYLKKYE